MVTSEPQSDCRSSNRQRARRAPQPLDQARLEELALAYVARFATSAARLDDYLRRKLRERGWAGEGDAGASAGLLVQRHVALGHVDDAAFARAKSASLLRRGYGQRRIGAALHAAGIAEPIRDDVRATTADMQQAALAMARRRRFGPFGQLPDEPLARRNACEKQLAAMLRAGHSFGIARALIHAPSEDAAQEWAQDGRNNADDHESECDAAHEDE